MISLAEPSTGKPTWCYNTRLQTNGDSGSLLTVYALVHKYQMEFMDIAGIRIFRVRGENSTKIFMVFMFTPSINDIKCFIVQIMHSNI